MGGTYHKWSRAARAPGTVLLPWLTMVAEARPVSRIMALVALRVASREEARRVAVNLGLARPLP